MSVYRDNARWGALVSEHRARTTGWVVASMLGAAISIAMFVYVPKIERPHPELWIAMIVLPLFSAFALSVSLGLRHLCLRCYERGLWFSDGRVVHEATWGEISAIDERYARPGALVAMTIVVPTGGFVVPRELRGFAAVHALIEKRVTVPRTRTMLDDRR